MNGKNSTCTTCVIKGDAYKNMKRFQDDYREKTGAYLAIERAVNIMLKEHGEMKEKLDSMAPIIVRKRG